MAAGPSSDGAAIVGAVVHLVSDLDKQTREFVTNSSGEFLFTAVVPGGYTVTVTHPGFKTYGAGRCRRRGRQFW